MRHLISLGIPSCTNQFSRNPRHQKIRQTFNLLGGQRAIRRNLLPLEETPSTAASTGMLSPKNRMSAPRRLPAVVDGVGRRETLQEKPHGVFAHYRETFSADELNVGSP